MMCKMMRRATAAAMERVAPCTLATSQWAPSRRVHRHVGSNIPIATGIAFSCKMRKTDNVISRFGDGASNEGVPRRNQWRGYWNLPVVSFVKQPVWCFDERQGDDED
jgi:TPP-dependent pyruvate/acetoin dehydrogenase alpha subunit